MNIDPGVAIIGMAGRFPGAATIDQLWQNLCAGIESIHRFENHELDSSIDPSLVSNRNYIRARGLVADYDQFDASFFKISPRQAALWDPQHRVFMETAWAALENAGYFPNSFEGAIGVYAGKSESTYRLNHINSNPRAKQQFDAFQIAMVNEKDYLPTSVSYYLDLKGPSINVQTACSTSLVAVAYAFDGLMTYQCDMALAGAISLTCPQESGYLWSDGSILSRDGHCRPFDAAAQGTVFSNGVGVVVLKRLEDAVKDGDHIYAVIRGVALNNDGAAGKMSFMAPSVEGQAAVIAMAQANAGVHPFSISYLEAHGTATPLGDPIEVEALTQAFRTQTRENGFCALGSIKGNFGHLDAAAGIAGLIKTALALKYKKIPPSLNFEKPNPNINFDLTPFYVNDRLSEWTPGKSPRLAGVSSFGVGGTNAHVILEEAPEVITDDDCVRRQLIVLSANTPSALETATRNLEFFFRRHPDINLADAAYTLQVGRKAFKHRRALVCEHAADAIEVLVSNDPALAVTGNSWSSEQQVVFMFTGQGSQHLYMGAGLYDNEPVFRSHVDRCSELLLPELGFNLRTVLYPDKENCREAERQLKQTAVLQPALFVLESALAHLWMDLGVRPAAMIGHSIGEYVAAYLSGVFSLESVLGLVAARGRLMQAQAPGAMLAVAISEESAKAYLHGVVGLAAVNAPQQCVFSGSLDVVEALKGKLAATSANAEARIRFTELQTSHAFHSALMDPAVHPFRELVVKADPKAPRIPFISNLTGTWISSEQAVDAAYWANHLRQTVRFSQGIGTLLESPGNLFIEIGPGSTLCNLVGLHQPAGESMAILPSLPHPRQKVSDHAYFLRAIGRYWITGGEIDWNRLHHNTKRRRMALPTYSFEGKRYWIEPICFKTGTLKEIEVAASEAIGAATELVPVIVVDHHVLIIKLWKNLLGLTEIQVGDNFFDLGGDSLSAAQVITGLRDHYLGEIPLRAIFDYPTVEGLAGYLAVHAHPTTVPAKRIAAERPLSEVERRLWYIHCFDSITSAHHMVLTFKVSGVLQAEYLQKAMDALIERHENLRTTFHSRGGLPYAAVGRTMGMPINIAVFENHKQMQQWISQEARKPFDWATGPLVRAALARVGSDEYGLALILHEIIASGMFVRTWIDEVFELYERFLGDKHELKITGGMSGNCDFEMPEKYRGLFQNGQTAPKTGQGDSVL